MSIVIRVMVNCNRCLNKEKVNIVFQTHTDYACIFYGKFVPVSSRNIHSSKRSVQLSYSSECIYL